MLKKRNFEVHFPGIQFGIETAPKALLVEPKETAFSVRIVGHWYRVPAYVVESPSVDVFKSIVAACWTEVFFDVI